MSFYIPDDLLESGEWDRMTPTERKQLMRDREKEALLSRMNPAQRKITEEFLKSMEKDPYVKAMKKAFGEKKSWWKRILKKK